MKKRGAMAAKAAFDFLYDSHCHIRKVNSQEAGQAASSPDTAALQKCVTNLVVCGTHPQIDWELVPTVVLRSSTANVLSGFGVHPWFVPSTQPPSSAEENAAPQDSSTAVTLNSESCGCNGASSPSPSQLTMTLPQIVEALQHRLDHHPRAIVAEIGLDKLRGPSEADQKAAFVAQLQVAAARNRPVSVHCVRHYGLLLQVLQDLSADDTPPAIVVHAFTGSSEVAKSLLNLKNKKRAVATTVAAAPSSSTTQPEVCEVSTTAQKDSEANVTGTDASPLPAEPATKKKTKRGGGASASADTVRIKERIYFGVGLSTSFTVKNFASQTLPMLLGAQRVVLETDAHYSGEFGWGSTDCETADECTAKTCLYVDEAEHAHQLHDVMQAVEAAAVGSVDLIKKAEAAGLTPEAMVRKSVVAAFQSAFSSVLE